MKILYICPRNDKQDKSYEYKNSVVMNFIKTFLAGILAFVVGSVLVFFLWIFILLGIPARWRKPWRFIPSRF